MGRKQRRFGFFAMMTLQYLSANFAHPVTPTFFNFLAFPDYMFGLALGIMLGFNFLVSPFWGRLNDFVSSRTLLLIGAFGYGTAQLLFGFSTEIWQVLLARAMAGTFISAVNVGMLTYIMHTARNNDDRATMLSTNAAITSVSGAFGYFIGGLIGEIQLAPSFPVLLPFLLQAAGLIVAGLGFFFFCEKEHGLQEKQPIGVIVRASNPLSAFYAARKFMTGTLLFLFIVSLLQQAGALSFDQSFNYYLNDQMQLTPVYNGVLKGIMGVLTLAINATLTVRLMRRGNLPKTVMLVLVFSAITMTATCFLDGFPIAFVVLNILVYAECSVSIPLLQGMVADYANGKDSNLMMGFYNSMKSFGGILGSLLAGFLYVFTPMMPFYFGLFAYTLGAVLAFVIFRRRAKRSSTVQSN